MSTGTLSPEGSTRAAGRRRGWLAAAAAAVAVGLVAAYMLVRPETTVVRDASYSTGVASQAQLADVAKLRIFFGHQSVGQNIIEAIPNIYAAQDVPGPTIVQSSAPIEMSGGYLQHAFVGTNGDPLSKISDFDRIMRSGIAGRVEVAAMKFCYIDFNEDTDVDQVFSHYQDTIERLSGDYPNVTFMYITVPLTTERSLVTRTKARLGLSDFNPPADNVVRERFNQKVRAEYSGTGRLFDIAAAQSSSGGIRTLRIYDGADYYSMESALASDLGHLNQTGATVIGSAFLEAIAQAHASNTH